MLLVSKIIIIHFSPKIGVIITRGQILDLCGCGFLVYTRANKQKMGKHKHEDKAIDDEGEDVDITNTVSLLYVIFCFK